jgi:hypothetical protein
VVVGLTALGFIAAKPVLLRFMPPQGFALQPNRWLALTAALIPYTVKRDPQSTSGVQ